MPSLPVQDLERCLSRKLKATERTGSKHREFELFDDEGHLVATTVLSRGWRGTTALSANMVAQIQRELGLQGQAQAFDQVIRCR